jgi:two-component system nitrate/nitrite response regulator NarL
MRCLLVDDSVRFLEEAQRTLKREGVCIVGVARTGAEALDLVASGPADLLLLDMDLGAESGLDLLNGLARESSLTSMRVILISAHGEDDFAELIEASPAAGFIPKAQLSAKAIYDILGETAN